MILASQNTLIRFSIESLVACSSLQLFYQYIQNQYMSAISQATSYKAITMPLFLASMDNVCDNDILYVIQDECSKGILWAWYWKAVSLCTQYTPLCPQ